MEVYINVKNFGKISEARVNISNFTVFVGNNNSGKTQLMELIYTVMKHLSSKIPNITIPRMEQMDAFSIGRKELCEMNAWVNAYLAKHINAIIEKSFHAAIPVEEVTLEFEHPDSSYEIYCLTEKTINYVLKENGNIREFLTPELISQAVADTGEFYGSIILKNNIQGDKTKIEEMRVPAGLPVEVARGIGICHVLADVFGAKAPSSSNVLFMPASRMGLSLLYKRYFANNRQDTGMLTRPEKEIGAVTEPVSDFLTFLLDYSYSERTAKKNDDLIRFISSYLIDGTIRENGETTEYIPEGQENAIPVFVASSMVNEVVPVVKALTDSKETDFIFYDEVETSMHPLKQMEMVKLLNRLNNKGVKLIVSTHSDTMATKMNNLLLLSYGDFDFEAVRKLLKKNGIDIEQEDLLISPNIHVYQFVNQSKDKSMVEELVFQKTPCTGYDFSLFHDSTMHLFEEAKIAMGIEDEN
ncbi:hypothetical protein C823_003439 [Eubacterium plexicaudatum ASF492]|uniref:Endonuclease GajA/Old nuclease/RecF-like AAA domain-containing protein n=1 Tax=Eubacterium plexicaudatum ASF492 TaxID=1235802 RepID=N2AER7_9FIRM|nr:hypothetical protein C823_003439 [Eubacterium plexicaudatum ASF492]